MPEAVVDPRPQVIYATSQWSVLRPPAVPPGIVAVQVVTPSAILRFPMPEDQLPGLLSALSESHVILPDAAASSTIAKAMAEQAAGNAGRN